MNRNIWIGIFISVALALFLMQVTAALTGHRLTPVDAIKELIRQAEKQAADSLPANKRNGSQPPKAHFPGSWGDAKQKMYKVWSIAPKTFYCDCRYGQEGVDHSSCGYSDSSMGERSRRTEAEHVVPASWIGAGKACWSNGREYCEANDKAFQDAAFDLHNLRPAIGYVNLMRSNYQLGIVRGEQRQFGACDFEVFDQVAEPPVSVRGDVARIHFYMMATHGVRIPDQIIEVMKRWHHADPVSDLECAIDARIAGVQGNHNPYVRQQCASSRH